jgi:hypothetical protein
MTTSSAIAEGVTSAFGHSDEWIKDRDETSKIMSDDNEPASHNSIIVIPSAARYAEQMEDLLHVCYGTTRDEPEQVFTAAMFRQHLDVFPAGQFIAVDTATDTVVGVTVSMRVNFNPQQRMTEGWWASIGYG